MPIESPPTSTANLDWQTSPLTPWEESDSSVRLVPASSFSIEQLVNAYNQTRVDYLVPMPMNAARLAEYIRIYDVDLDRSQVAVEGDQSLGLAMLGMRPDRAWITRLGVLPIKRRRGVGEALMQALLETADQLKVGCTSLEVIKHNTPAHTLFLKLGFIETSELLILRRPPGPPAETPPAEIRWLERAEALALLSTRMTPAAWTNETQSLANIAEIRGLSSNLPDGSTGWLIFEQEKFILSHFGMLTVQGDPVAVGRALLAHLYQSYPHLDTHTENILVNDPHLPAFFQSRFVESFRRIEMYRC
ncbi:MAG TPA: GNAT family N-acetyltransferase [Anaerolineae bacterium]|nr:GNAT family N-acetyltransferase [Anaerolineae bacterium]